MIHRQSRRVLLGLAVFAAAAGGFVAQLSSQEAKRTIENSIKAVVAGKSADAGNPKVPPGQVQWHATFEAACAVAGKSGKPVLLFQMMGKLDEQFC
jgi:hypothetical protein